MVGVQRDLGDHERSTQEDDAALILFSATDCFGWVIVKVLTIKVADLRLEAESKVHHFGPGFAGFGDAAIYLGIAFERRRAHVQDAAAVLYHLLVLRERVGLEVHILR